VRGVPGAARFGWGIALNSCRGRRREISGNEFKNALIIGATKLIL
jgi:hypothetical protein